MKIVESKRKNFKEFYEIADGTVFRFDGKIFIKTKDFFSAEEIENYFDNSSTMRNVNDMYDDYDAYNAYCLSRDDCYAFSSLGESAKVEVIDVELHIV